jgi:CarD family transcriptional regulator
MWDLRPVITAQEVTKVYKPFSSEHDVIIENQPWNRRYRDYMKKIKTGSVFEVAQVLRDLFLLRSDKELSVSVSARCWTPPAAFWSRSSP